MCVMPTPACQNIPSIQKTSPNRFVLPEWLLFNGSPSSVCGCTELIRPIWFRNHTLGYAEFLEFELVIKSVLSNN